MVSEEPLMRTALTTAFLAMIAGQVYAQTPTGTIIIYRQRGANFGLLHYAQGEHPTIYCDDAKVAKLAERRKTTVSAVTGPHLCEANEKQYPGELNADSESISVKVKPGSTTYLRLESHFGHVHFVLREVSPEIGSAETDKMQPVKGQDSYSTVLASNKEKTVSP